MILLIDVGNSNIVFSFSDLNNLYNIFRVETNIDKSSTEYYNLIKIELDKLEFNDVIISSVVPRITNALNDLFIKYYNIEPKILGPNMNTGIILNVDEPNTVGADLICDALGAMLYSNEAIIVDLGTATKYIYCKNNVFYGCSIAPGVITSMKSLFSNTALLFEIDLNTPKKVISKNTTECIQSGVIYGAASQVDGMIIRIKEELNNFDIPVYATGGLSKLIIPFCKNKIELMENLTIDGLLAIYKKNFAA